MRCEMRSFVRESCSRRPSINCVEICSCNHQTSDDARGLCRSQHRYPGPTKLISTRAASDKPPLEMTGREEQSRWGRSAQSQDAGKCTRRWPRVNAVETVAGSDNAIWLCCGQMLGSSRNVGEG